jgi:long-chain acyl-CoA synthetase
MNVSFINLVETSIKKHWDFPAFSDINGPVYLYKDVAKHIENLHIFFEEAGIKPGDKIAIVGKNSANWAISFFAIVSYGAVVVPILNEFKPDNIHHIINHSEAKSVFVASGNWKNMDKTQMPGVNLFMLIDDFSILECADKKLFEVRDNINDYFEKRHPNGFSAENVKYAKDEPDALALLNYTSGTTSSSKGVMLPYRSLWSNTQFAYDNLPYVKAGDDIVCLLPMAHMYGLAFEVLNSFNKGCHIHFITGKPTPNVLASAFVTCKPILILSVPLIIEKIVKGKVFPELQKPLVKTMLKIPVLKSIVKEKIAKQLETAFGGNFGEIIIGGAAINNEVETFLDDIHFRYTVGYGMTECGPLISYAPWNEFKPSSVGRVVDRMEARIDSEDPANVVGEILVKGMNVMLGYYKNEEATKAVFTKDGWMRTGDLGTMDKDGFVFIKGRCKNLILSSNGQNIYPEEIEDKINNLNYVVESLVISEGGKLIALVFPDRDAATKAGLTEEELSKQLSENIKKLNNDLPSYSKISETRLQKEEFEKTPKKSIKRFLYQPKEG